MSTTPNSPTVCAKRQDRAGDDPGPSQRHDDAGKRPQTRRAETPGGLDQRAIDRRKRGGERLDGERQAVQDRRDQESLERKDDRAAGQRLVGAADGASRSQRHEDVVSEDGRRQHERQRDERVDGPSAPPVRQREPARERQSDRQQDDRRRRREPEAEGDGRPVHRGFRTTRLQRELRRRAGRTPW